MVIEARETILGIPYKKPELLATGKIEPLKVDEGDIAEDYIFDRVWKDAVVDSPDKIRVRDKDSHGKVINEQPLSKQTINFENPGRRRFIIHRRTLRWRP